MPTHGADAYTLWGVNDTMIPGRGLWRGVYSAIVDHPDFHVLTPQARLTLLVCRLGSLNNQASIFRYYREPLCVQTGLAPHELEAALCDLETKPSKTEPWIMRDNLILWVRNGLKYDPNLTPTQNEAHRVGILRAVSALPHTPLVTKFMRYYKLGRATPRPSPRGSPPSTREGLGISTPIPKGKEEERTPKDPPRFAHANGSNGHPTPEQQAEHDTAKREALKAIDELTRKYKGQA